MRADLILGFDSCKEITHVALFEEGDGVAQQMTDQPLTHVHAYQSVNELGQIGLRVLAERAGEEDPRERQRKHIEQILVVRRNDVIQNQATEVGHRQYGELSGQRDKHHLTDLSVQLGAQHSHARQRSGYPRTSAYLRKIERRCEFEKITGHVFQEGVHRHPATSGRRIKQPNIAACAFLEDHIMRAAKVQDRAGLDLGEIRRTKLICLHRQTELERHIEQVRH